MSPFAVRSTEAEWMDDATLSRAAFEACLRSLERVNIATLAYGPTLRWLKRAVHGPCSILDVGSGGGDMLRRIYAWGTRRGLALSLRGVDLNPWSKTLADSCIPPDATMEFITANLFDLPPEPRPDFIISALFTHHLTEAELIRFLQWMEQRAARGWFISDLHRHPLPYHFIRFATALFRMNPIVRHDAPISVARAFQRRDWLALLEKASIPAEHVRIRWHI